jgi:hypothetical protein
MKDPGFFLRLLPLRGRRSGKSLDPRHCLPPEESRSISRDPTVAHRLSRPAKNAIKRWRLVGSIDELKVEKYPERITERPTQTFALVPCAMRLSLPQCQADLQHTRQALRLLHVRKLPSPPAKTSETRRCSKDGRLNLGPGIIFTSYGASYECH